MTPRRLLAVAGLAAGAKPHHPYALGAPGARG
ncbi:hypothetical protein BJ981_001756 [Sphaerisporangium krabiense]|uniref:Uncharacterized protein n=1 Tax=Sphaerisporangium krabiense TaxID=763782 RepID=A0A7W8Z299_9ACTN|nr:hypothetical protein [Sphaerisporangium krabiense]